MPKEVSIQFNEDRREGAAEHQLVELRLYVPPGSGRDGDEENEDESDALRIQQQITQAANLKSVTGSLLAEFAPSEGVFVLPRGRYAVEMYADFFRMHGNMYDYKIAYSDVERFILLPRTDDVHYAFIVALDRPIRQGQQRYPHLVWQLKKTEAEIMVKLTEEQITSKYGANCGLKPELSGALYQLVARVFKVLSGKKVFTTGKFRSSDGRHAVSCSVKASTGQLYPLERSLAFIHKPLSSSSSRTSVPWSLKDLRATGSRPRPKTSTSRFLLAVCRGVLFDFDPAWRDAAAPRGPVASMAWRWTSELAPRHRRNATATSTASRRRGFVTTPSTRPFPPRALVPAARDPRRARRRRQGAHVHVDRPQRVQRTAGIPDRQGPQDPQFGGDRSSRERGPQARHGPRRV